ncbi:hypothetical protein BDF14DRAFT_1771786 [Spinellus fusiger]|nr:hypothetical protein BDF14DRAFT_1771786 [Spinellus fusiger]
MLCSQQDVNEETDKKPEASYSGGMRRMLKKEGFKLYLINEFKISSLCPGCKYSPLEIFKHVKNPRPYQ